MAPESTGQVHAILNAAWMVRHYSHGSPVKRAEAIRQLGLVVRQSLNSSEDFEPVLAALVDGLRPKDDRPF